MLTVLVVVAHLGFLGVRSATGSVDGLFDDADLLGVGRARGGGVNGGTGDVGRLAVGGAGAGGVDGELVNGGGGLEGGRAEAGGVDGGGGHGELLAVVGLDTRTILALGNVDDRVVRAVVVIELDTRLVVGGLRSDGPRAGWVSWDEGERRREGKEGKRKKTRRRVFCLMPVKRRDSWPLSSSPHASLGQPSPPQLQTILADSLSRGVGGA
jgi:hypothetical protein